MFNPVAFVQTLFPGNAPKDDRTVVETIPSTNFDARAVAEAIVTKTISPGRKGQVKFQGSWWTARCNDEITLMIGDIVQVTRRQDLTLYIEPISRFHDFCNVYSSPQALVR